MSSGNITAGYPPAVDRGGGGGPIISDDVLYWVQLVNYIGICGLVSVLGIVANVINITVFIRQGVMSDSSNISLLGLAVSDLMCLVTLLWLAICFLIIYIRPSDLNFDPFALMVVTAGRPHAMFVGITCWITVYISLERCMCVMFPLKFKMMFTARKTACIIPSIFILIICLGYVPYYCTEYLKWQAFGNTSSRQILTIYQEDNYLKILNIPSYVNGLISKTVSPFLVLVFTQITAHRIDVSSRWRKSMTSGGNHDSTEASDVTSGSKSSTPNTAKQKAADQISQKDQKLIRMIRVICIIFLTCYTGNVLCITTERIEPEVRPRGKYNNLFFFIYSFSFALEAINSSCNILVYYKMSTKYRTELRRLFHLDDATK